MPVTTLRRRQRQAAAAALPLVVLTLLAVPTARAFLTQQHPAAAAAHTTTATATLRHGLAGSTTSPTRLHGIEDLYNGEPLDPNRRVLKLAFLATSRPKQPPKSDKEKQLEEKVWGRWKMVEESIDRPSRRT